MTEAQSPYRQDSLHMHHHSWDSPNANRSGGIRWWNIWFNCMNESAKHVAMQPPSIPWSLPLPDRSSCPCLCYHFLACNFNSACVFVACFFVIAKDVRNRRGDTRLLDNLVRTDWSVPSLLQSPFFCLQDAPCLIGTWILWWCCSLKESLHAWLRCGFFPWGLAWCFLVLRCTDYLQENWKIAWWLTKSLPWHHEHNDWSPWTRRLGKGFGINSWKEMHDPLRPRPVPWKQMTRCWFYFS